MIFRILGPHASAHTPNPSPGLSFPPNPNTPRGSPPGVLAGTEVSDLTSPGQYAPSSPCWQHVEMGYLGGGPQGGQIGLLPGCSARMGTGEGEDGTQQTRASRKIRRFIKT